MPGELTPEQLPAGAYGPASIVLGAQDTDIWQQAGLRVLTPPAGGWLEVQTDGLHLWVEGGR
jgi:hypothetical protein